MALSAVVLLGGCSFEERSGLEEDTVHREFLSVLPSVTRTSLDDSFSVDWTAGDRILYYSSDGGRIGAFEIARSGHTALIEAEMGVSDHFITAIYGASDISDNTEHGCVLSGAVRAEQSGSFSEVHVSAARCVNPEKAELAFYNLSSIIRFSLTRNDVSYVVVTASDGTALHASGKILVDFSGGVPSASYPEKGRGSSIKVKAGGAGIFYVATLPCTVGGLSFELFDSDGESVGKAATPATTIIERNTLVDFGELDGHIVPSPAAASIGSRRFSSMDKALAAFNASDTAAVLKLEGDHTNSGTYYINNKKASLSLDLNGYVLSAPMVKFSVDSLAIIDSSSEGNGRIISTGDYLLYIYAGSISLNSGAVSGGAKGTYLYAYNSKFYMRGGRYEAEGTLFTGTKGKYFITGGEFDRLPDIELPYPYVAKWVNDSTYSVCPASISIGVARWGGNRTIFRNAISASGAYPVLFDSYAVSDAIAKSQIESVDALVIPGKASGDTSVRAACENRLLNACLKQHKPVLGICLGIQRINKFKGGTVPAVETLAPNTPYTHKLSVGGVNVGVRQETHPIDIDKSSVLYGLYGGQSRIMVNTSHNYACGKIGTGLKVVATAPDGIVEAVEPTDDSMMYGVQYHPEALFHYAGLTSHLVIFRYLIQKAEEVKK